MRVRIIDKYNSFYFIGIGGVSMSGLAKYLVRIGKKVGGSDIARNEYTEELQMLGVKVDFSEDCGGLVNYDLIICTDAIRDTDKRLIAAQSLNKEIISRGHFLYEISRGFKKVIAVSGCHGKTTCTSMLAHIFFAANKNFTSHIGGNDLKFKNFYYGGNDYFITEACEFKKNFLLLKPNISVILNSDADHIECYGSEAELKRSYMRFADGADVAICLFRDLPVEHGISFGFDKSADYCAKNIKSVNGTCSFTAYEGGTELGSVKLKVYGKHNVLNAVAAIAAARTAGIKFEEIKNGLQSFEGVERRFEKIGTVNGAVCIADYAHHPSEIRATLRAVQKITDGKVYAVFQPHTYSRTKFLFQQFVKVLSPLNNLLIYKTYAAREYFDDAGSALTLSQSLKKSRYGDDAEDIYDFITRAKEGDVVLFLGAGDIYYLAKSVLNKT